MNLKMKLNHVSFPTKNVHEEAAFFETYFKATIAFIVPDGPALLRHGDIDIVLDTISDDLHWPKDFHFGFELDTKLELEEMYATFRQGAVNIETEIFNRVGRGSRFFGRTPGGIQFEFNTREDMEEKWKTKA